MKKFLSSLLLVAAFVLPVALQAQQTPPFSDDFEGTSSWTFVNGTQTNTWCIGTATSNGGTHAMYITNNGGTSNAYTTNSTTVVFAYKEFTLNASQYAFAYDWKGYGESGWDYLRVALVPASETFTAGTLPSGVSPSALPSTWIALDGGSQLNLQSTWQSFSGTFTVAAAGDYKIVFLWRNDGSGGTNPPTAIDNFAIVPNTCPLPTALTASNITATSADFTWTAGGSETSWQYCYYTDGSTPDWATATTSTTPSASLTGLTPSTPYHMAVRAYCSATDQSLVTSTSFRTACGVETLPYSENFEDETPNTVVPCWDNSMSTTTSLSANPHYVWGVYNYNDNNMIRMYNYLVNAGIAAINTPQIALPAGGSYQLKFDYSHTATSGDFLVKVTTDGGTTFTTIATLTKGSGSSQNDPGTFTPVTYDLSAYAGNTIMVQFYNNANYGSGAIFVDNIVVRVTPSCPEPTDVAVGNIAAHSATVSWTPGAATQSNFTVAYGTGTDVDSMTTVSATAATATLTGLQANTTYHFYVKSVCSATDQSLWTSMGTFRTECESVTVFPYVEDFNSYSTGSSASISPCWHKGTNHPSTAYPYPSTSTTYALDGNYLYFYGYHTSTASSCRYSYAALPLMDTNINNLMMTFKLARYNSSTTSYTTYLVVGVMTDPNDIATFVPYDTIDLTTATPASVHDIEVIFNNYSGSQGHIAFYCPDVVPSTATGTTGTNYACLDDVVVDLIPSCWTVDNLTTVAGQTTQNSITLSWTERNASVNQWSVSYIANGSTTLTTQVVNSNPATITGLAANTAYTFYVSSICAAGDTANAKSTTGRTVCPASLSAPYFENFEGYTNVSSSSYSPTTAEGYPNLMPACWPASVMYSSASSTASNAPQFFMTRSASIANGGIVMALRGYSTTKPAVLALPQLTNAVNTLQIDFDYRQYYASYGTLQLGVMTDPADTTSFVAVQTLPRTTTYTHVNHDFGLDTNLPTGELYIALRHTQGSTSSSYCSYVDNLSITVAPTCKAPVNVALDAATETTATLVWSMPLTHTAANYLVAYGGGDFDAGDTATWMGSANATSMSATITGLQAGTGYRAAVRGLCSATEQSNWSSTVSFYTNCPSTAHVIDAAHNLVEGFDDNNVNPCWNVIYADSTNADINPVTTVTQTGANGKCLRFSSYSSVSGGDYRQYVVSPEFSGADRMKLTFRYKVYNSYDTLWCGLSSTTNDLSSFSWYLLPANTTWTDVTADLNSGMKYFAFKYNGNCAYYGYVDDVELALWPKHNVTANVNDAAMGTVNGNTGLLYEDDLDTLVAVANPNYHFVNWSNGSTNDTITFTVERDTAFTAYFAPDTFTVNVAVNDTLMGTATGAGDYAYNTQATLTATPNTGYHFVAWNDNDTNATRTVTVLGNTTYTATFAINQYAVTVVPNDTLMGTVTGTGIYSHGASATLTATPNTGYHFVAWNDSDTNATRTVTVTADITYTATFAVNQYTLTVVSNDETMGTVTGSGVYNHGAEATLTANANTGYHFVAWNDNDTNATRTVTVTEDQTYTATFAEDEVAEVYVNISVNDSTMGYTNPAAGSYVYHVGDTLRMEAIANEGYRFVSWSIMGQPVPMDVLEVIFDEMAAGQTLDAVATFAPATGINDVDADKPVVYTENNKIVVVCATDANVYVYDVVGRCIGKARGNATFTMDKAGVYLVKVGNAPVQRVVVAK